MSHEMLHWWDRGSISLIVLSQDINLYNSFKSWLVLKMSWVFFSVANIGTPFPAKYCRAVTGTISHLKKKKRRKGLFCLPLASVYAWF